ncbi:MAG: hypothetical protein IKG66_00365, partial [Lachnospiraceae bacterium]|nr:hypothetical protein [Lachnospiraceae bacterium]
DHPLAEDAEVWPVMLHPVADSIVALQCFAIQRRCNAVLHHFFACFQKNVQKYFFSALFFSGTPFAYYSGRSFTSHTEKEDM